jgi:hypothetical protein
MTLPNLSTRELGLGKDEKGQRATGNLHAGCISACVFPVSPDPTGFALGMVAIANAIPALNVVLFSYKALGHI